MSNNRYKFKEPETTACFVCEHVLNKTRPILLVTHDDDGEYEYWQFLCGETDHGKAGVKITSMRKATEIDPSVNDLHDMPVGVRADRKSVKSPWQPYSINK